MTATAMTDDVGGFLPAAPATEPILVTVDFRRSKGVCNMIVDARALHSYLERIGVEVDSANQFRDRPQSATAVVETGYNRISTEALLKRGGPHEFNLGTVYGRPPTLEVLTAISQSVKTKIDAIVEHYRPIEISVVIHSKGGK